MSQHALILGANSDLARALAHRYARAGWHLYLAARQPERLEADVEDLKVRYGIQAQALEFDAAQFNQHMTFARLLDPRPELVFCVFGYLGDQAKAESDWDEASRIIETNYVGAVSIMSRLAEEMSARGKGTLVGISSVAGERGRASNYYYGSAKAGFTAYLSGLRNRMTTQNTGVKVITVKPGFMRTAMTEGLKLNPWLTASPKQAANDIYHGVAAGRSVIYTKWMWRPIMWVIRHLPEGMFKKRDW